MYFEPQAVNPCAVTLPEKRVYPSMRVEFISYAAATLTTFAFLPQAVKALKEHDTHSLSLGMYVIFTMGVALWGLYGWLRRDWAIVVANVITGGLCLRDPDCKDSQRPVPGCASAQRNPASEAARGLERDSDAERSYVDVADAASFFKARVEDALELETQVVDVQQAHGDADAAQVLGRALGKLVRRCCRRRASQRSRL